MTTTPVDSGTRFSLRAPALYPNEYVWFVFVSSMDIMLTWVILRKGGTEVNPIANMVIEGWGLPGAIVFKFSLTLFVIAIAEVIGRNGRPRTARSLATLAVAISAMPVAYSLFLLTVHTYAPMFQ